MKVSTAHKGNFVHNDQLSFEMSWHHWPWTFQWSLVNWRNAAWMGPLSSWIWSLENCPVEVLLRCFKGLAWMCPGGSNWPLIMATSCQWVECCLNSRAVLFLCLRVSLQDFLSSNYSHLAISPCLIYMFLFFVQGVFLFLCGVFFGPPENWDKNKSSEMVPSQLEKYQTVQQIYRKLEYLSELVAL